jgi:protein-disulfide isomerase
MRFALFAPIFGAFALMGALAQPTAALDLNEMTQGERDLFRSEVRAYLLDNPEVLMEAIAILEDRQAEAEAANDMLLAQSNFDALHNDGFSWEGGNSEGDLVLVEFLDYRCSFCRRAHPEVADLVAGDGNIRIIVKEFPILGEQSVMASRFAIATKIVAGDEASKEVSDALINLRSDISIPVLAQLADFLELDAEAITAEMESDAVTAVIEENQALAQRMQISGTPTFVFGDQMLRGYVPLAGMQNIAADLRAEG